ncbi:MAG: alpha/beta hydrolase family protein [Promethearchaeota archaeon]
MTDIIIEDIEIPTRPDDIILKGSIYYTAKNNPKAPFIIILPGFQEDRESGFVKFFSTKFAENGYYVLSYDYRAHGETKTKYRSKWNIIFPLIFSDIHLVLDWILEDQSERLLNNKIALVGRSLGGAIVLSHGFIDERAKILIALATRYDYHTTQAKFQEEAIQKFSPHNFLRKHQDNHDRILIAHCKDDTRVPFHNLIQIQELLELHEDNVIKFDNGGHSFKGCREEIFKYFLEFLKKL